MDECMVAHPHHVSPDLGVWNPRWCKHANDATTLWLRLYLSNCIQHPSHTYIRCLSTFSSSLAGNVGKCVCRLHPSKDRHFVCRRHVGNVVPTRRQNSVVSANFSAVRVVSVRPVADTHCYMYIGISIDEVVTTHEDKKNWHPLRFASSRKYLL